MGEEMERVLIQMTFEGSFQTFLLGRMEQYMMTPLTIRNSHNRSYSFELLPFGLLALVAASVVPNLWLSVRFISAGVFEGASCFCFIVMTGTLSFDFRDQTSFFYDFSRIWLLSCLVKEILYYLLGEVFISSTAGEGDLSLTIGGGVGYLVQTFSSQISVLISAFSSCSFWLAGSEGVGSFTDSSLSLEGVRSSLLLLRERWTDEPVFSSFLARRGDLLILSVLFSLMLRSRAMRFFSMQIQNSSSQSSVKLVLSSNLLLLFSLNPMTSSSTLILYSPSSQSWLFSRCTITSENSFFLALLQLGRQKLSLQVLMTRTGTLLTTWKLASMGILFSSNFCRPAQGHNYPC